MTTVQAVTLQHTICDCSLLHCLGFVIVIPGDDDGAADSLDYEQICASQAVYDFLWNEVCQSVGGWGLCMGAWILR